MSFDEDIIFDKIKKMEPEKASEILISILLTSDEWERRAKAIDNLISCKDKDHFKEMKSIYLNESYSEAKIKLIELLSKCYQEDGISFLTPQYKSEKDWNVRKKIIEAVVESRKADTIPFLIEALGDPNSELKKSAINALGNIKATDALKPLIELLKFRRNEEILDSLINTIVKIGKKADIQDIIKHLQKADLNIKKALPIIIGKIGDMNAVDALINLLKFPNPTVRKNTVIALGKFINLINKDFRSIIEMLNDIDLEVKNATINVLGSIGSKKAINPLIELLKDENDKIRKNTVKALEKILVSSKSFNEVYDLLEKKNIVARREAVKLLSGATGDPNAMQILIRLFNSEDSRIRRLAFSAVLKISQNKVDNLILEALKAREWQIRKFSAKILGEIKDENNIDLLLNLLNDPKSGVRRAATDSLAKISTSKVVNKTIAFLNNSDWRIRRAAVNILIKIGSDEALEPLITCLNDEDSYIKSWAAKSLGKLKNIKDIQPLINLLESEDSKIRISAVNALAEIKDKKALKPLISALGDDNWDVRKEIERALKLIDPEWMNKI